MRANKSTLARSAEGAEELQNNNQRVRRDQYPGSGERSNKTDLLQGNKLGGQIGISYNFSSLAGLFGGSGSN